MHWGREQFFWSMSSHVSRQIGFTKQKEIWNVPTRLKKFYSIKNIIKLSSDISKVCFSVNYFQLISTIFSNWQKPIICSTSFIICQTFFILLELSGFKKRKNNINETKTGLYHIIYPFFGSQNSDYVSIFCFFFLMVKYFRILHILFFQLTTEKSLHFTHFLLWTASMDAVWS